MGHDRRMDEFLESTINDLGQPVGLAITVPLPDSPPPGDAMEGVFCRLVPLAEAHGDELWAAFSAADDISWTYLPYGPFATRDAFDTWLGAWTEQPDQDARDPMFFTIIDLISGRCTGLAAYLRIDPRSASVEVGHIHFSPSLQRTAAATEAMYLMMKRAFEANYRRYEWKCDALNAPSIAAAHRLGFAYEGTFRHATHYKGRNRDTAWFAMIESDWPRIDRMFQQWLAADNFDGAGQQRARLSTTFAF